MKALFDLVSHQCSKTVTEAYSTSFSLATKMLATRIRQDIYNIYGFVRFADEIVDSFHDYDKEDLFNRFEADLNRAIKDRISLNPILNAFQETFHKYSMRKDLLDSFMKSMRLDLHKNNYLNEADYKMYIHGSAEVVGLMCLKVFVDGDMKMYQKLENSAKSLGAAFQKVNFLRDVKEDYELLNRTYFPNTNLNQLDEAAKQSIIEDIENDFALGLKGIEALPIEARFGVFMAYRYYNQLLKKLKNTPAPDITSTRIRVPNYKKFAILTQSYVKYQLNLM